MLRILDEKGGVVPGAQVPDLPPEKLRSLYRSMLLPRLLDERLLQLQRQGRIAFFGPSTGEEAAVIGSASALLDEDWIFPALRQGGALLLRGFPLELYFHHMFGTALSIEKGRSMPMHFSDRRFRFVTWSSSMATQLPHAVGAAYAMKLRGDRTVALAYLGDGASSEGDFHVAMNFAGVWRVPVVFFLQNNGWAISVPTSLQTASESFAIKAKAYGFPGVQVDGNDVLACFVATKEAVDRAREGKGPTLIEAVTYRLEGHSSSDDPSRYRSREEVERWKALDPLVRFRAYLERRGIWSVKDEEEARREIEGRIERAVKEAERGPRPDVRTLVEDVYADVPPHLRKEFERAFGRPL